MANAGGAWDNAKKVVEVDLKEKGTELHAATVIGDTVGDPFKDTSSVALNPIIKFTTLVWITCCRIIGITHQPIWKRKLSKSSDPFTVRLIPRGVDVLCVPIILWHEN